MAKWLALLALAACTPQERYSNSYKGKTPPELVSEAGRWINAADPLTLEKLRGKVVWLEFSFLN